MKIRVNRKLFTSTPQGTKRGAESMAAAQALRSMGVEVEEDNRNVENGHGGPQSLLAPPKIPGMK